MSHARSEEKSDVPAIRLGLLKPGDGEKEGGSSSSSIRNISEEPASRRRGFHNVNFFILNIVVLNMARMALKMYLGGTIRTIERRFGFRSSTTGLLFSLTDIAHIVLVLFFGYFGRTGHKPRIIAITSVFPAIAGLLMAAPYFILPKASSGAGFSSGVANSSGVSTDPYAGAQMCDAVPEDEGCDEEMDRATQNSIALGFFLVASLLTGVAGPSTITLGIPYIDENASRAKTAIGVGLITASFSMGPVLGLLLASGCTRLPENLKATDMDPTDPNFIGAWWLGFVLGGVAVFLLGIPMFFYPKHITPKAVAMAEEHRERSRAHHHQNVLVGKLKEFLRTMSRLFRVKPYVTLMSSDLFGVFVIVGIFWNLTRYMEIHFLMPAYQANIVGALSSAIMSLVGGLLGGTLISKLKLDIRGISKMLLICSGTVLMTAFLVLFIRCPKVTLDGELDAETNEFSLTTTCNRNCSCLANKNTYMSVCGGADGDLTYFSPCHAGCSISANGSFYDCACATKGIAKPGLCLETCNLFYVFALALAMISLVGGAGKPAHVLGVMRSVPDGDRPLAIGINSFAVNLIGLLPGPVFFGYMIDTACDLWQNICGESGNCLFYDTDKFRWRTYGITVVFIFGNFLFLILFFCLVRRREPGSEETTDADDQKDVNENFMDDAEVHETTGQM